MKKLFALIALASVISIAANTPELSIDALKKIAEENKKKATQELNEAIQECLKQSQNSYIALVTYAELELKNKPDSDLTECKSFMELYAHYRAINEACHQKISAMAKFNQTMQAKIVVAK